MNCFRHPTVTALAFCRHCGKRLCRECCRTPILFQTRVCSEECARLAALEPTPKEPTDTPFQKIYAWVFLTLLLALLGGGLCLWLAQSELAHADADARAKARGEYVPDRDHDSVIQLFYLVGIRNWKVQFGIGATIGATIAALWIRRAHRKEREPSF